MVTFVPAGRQATTPDVRPGAEWMLTQPLSKEKGGNASMPLDPTAGKVVVRRVQCHSRWCQPVALFRKYEAQVRNKPFDPSSYVKYADAWPSCSPVNTAQATLTGQLLVEPDSCTSAPWSWPIEAEACARSGKVVGCEARSSGASPAFGTTEEGTESAGSMPLTVDPALTWTARSV